MEGRRTKRFLQTLHSLKPPVMEDQGQVDWMDGWIQRRPAALTHPHHPAGSQLQHTDLAQNLLHISTEYL